MVSGSKPTKGNKKSPADINMPWIKLAAAHHPFAPITEEPVLGNNLNPSDFGCIKGMFHSSSDSVLRIHPASSGLFREQTS